MKIEKRYDNFIACDKDYKESKIVIFGAPFDGTTSYRPGTRFASSHIRKESFSIETYSPYQDKDLEEISVMDSGDLELGFGNTNKALNAISDCVSKIIKDNKIPCMIGGEHLVTLGAVRSLVKKYDNLKVIHFDAHTDLREDYLGEKYSHASVMKRVWELTGDKSIFQFGIRSGLRDEFKWAEEHIFINKYDFKGIEEVSKSIQDKPVYLSIDLDVLDPSEFPGTGTPEAGGVSYKELINAISVLSKLNIVGFDMVELSPVYDQSGISTSLACKLLRELLLFLYK